MSTVYFTSSCVVYRGRVALVAESYSIMCVKYNARIMIKL